MFRMMSLQNTVRDHSATRSMTPSVGMGPNSAITGVHVAYGLLVVAWICVLMKLSLKVIGDRPKWKSHDYFTMLALAFATAEVIIIGVDVQDDGEGQHLAAIPKEKLNVVFRLLDHMYIMYEMALMFIKLSILSFYLGLFEVKKRFRYATYFMMAFVVVYLTIFVFIDTFRCTPLRKMWFPVTVEGTCLNGVFEQRAFGILNAITDVVILIMPFPVLLRLQMSKSKLLSLGLIFSIGAFTCGAAITRTVIIWKTLSDSDPTWSIGPEVTWMNVEMLVGLICGSLLASPALLKHFVQETKIGHSLTSLFSSQSDDKILIYSKDNPKWNDWDRRRLVESSISGQKSVELQDKAPLSSSKWEEDKFLDRNPASPNAGFGSSHLNTKTTIDASLGRS